jgi:cobalt-zinc-cadmium efflux system outer membrane protein
MTTMLKAAVLAIASIAITETGYAQEAQLGGDAPRPIVERYIDQQSGVSLNEAIARAIEHEPSFRAARTAIDGAQGMRLQAGLRPNPTVSFERRQAPGGTDNQTMAQVEWPLDLFRRASRLAVADRELETTQRSVEDQRRLLVAEVRTRYGRLAAAVRDLSITDNVTSSARRELALLRRRVEEGAAPPLDRDLLEVELLRLESDRLLAAGRADAALFDLKRTIGAPTDAPLMLRDTLDVLAPPAIVELDPQTARAGEVSAPARSAPAERPDIREAEARVRLSDARVERAQNDGRFDVSLFASYMRMDTGFPQRGFDEAGSLVPVRDVFHYVAAGAMVTVPLRNRNQGELVAARAARTGAAAQLEGARLSAEAEVATAAAQEGQARRALAFAARSVRLAQQNLDVLQQTYELGRGTVSDVLAAQRRYLDVEHGYSDTLKAAYEARAALQRARGEE